MSDNKQSAERDEISKNYEETLTDVDEESEEIYQILKTKKMIQNQTNQKMMKEIRQKSQNYLKVLLEIFFLSPPVSHC